MRRSFKHFEATLSIPGSPSRTVSLEADTLTAARKEARRLRAPGRYIVSLSERGKTACLDVWDEAHFAHYYRGEHARVRSVVLAAACAPAGADAYQHVAALGELQAEGLIARRSPDVYEATQAGRVAYHAARQRDLAAGISEAPLATLRPAPLPTCAACGADLFNRLPFDGRCVCGARVAPDTK